MAKTRPIPAAEVCFRTHLVYTIACDICPARSYSGVVGNAAAHALPDEVCFSARGWRLYQHPTWGVMQVCRNCARKLGAHWTPVEPAK